MLSPLGKLFLQDFTELLIFNSRLRTMRIFRLTFNSHDDNMTSMNPIKIFASRNKVKIKEVSRLADCTPSYLYQIINGYRKPSAALALRIEQATGGAVTRMELLYPEKEGQR